MRTLSELIVDLGKYLNLDERQFKEAETSSINRSLEREQWSLDRLAWMGLEDRIEWRTKIISLKYVWSNLSQTTASSH